MNSTKASGLPNTNETAGGNLTFFGGCAINAANENFDQVSFVIAITLAIMAAVSNNLGVNLQKLAWTKKQKATSSVRTYRIIWLLGMLGIILASVFDFVALAFGPQSVIAPLGALTMVMNACIAPWMHGEKLPRIVFLATFIIVSGCATAVATASHANIICNLNGIFAFYLTPQAIAYFCVVTVISCSIFLFIRRAERILREFKNDSDEYQRIFKMHRVSYALVAGLMGAQSVVFARAIGMLFQSTVRGEDLFLTRGQTYGILIGLVASIYIQLLYLNKGLERFESTYNVPVFTGTFIVSTAVAGGIVYGEFNNFAPLQAVLFPLGVLLCVSGVAMLARGGAPNDTDSEDDDVVTDVASPVHSKSSKPGNSKHSMGGSIVTIADIKDLENPDPIPKPPPSPVLPTPLPLGPTPKNASLRIRSGGFIPFVIEENRHRRSSSTASRPRARTDTIGNSGGIGDSAGLGDNRGSVRTNWLLGFRIDEEEDYVREGSTPSY